MPTVKIADFDIDDEALHLRDLMAGVLSRVESVFVSYGVPLPSRRYWTIGQPVMDCEQLTVSFINGYLGAPGDQIGTPNKCNVPRTATMLVEVSRPIPVVGQGGRAPSPEAIQTGSEMALVDSWILLQSINLLDYWDEDLGAMSGPGVIATVEVGAVQGGFVVTSMSVTMAVP
jgi:hypothetical protein